MSEPPTDAPRTAFTDERADYDDDFGKTYTPREKAQRRVRIPAFAFMGIGLLGMVGTLVGIVAFTVAQIDYGLRDEFEWLAYFVGCWCLLMGSGIFVAAFYAGRCLRRLQKYRFVLVTAYIVTGLSLGGCYAIPFYPFGIWALILLYHPDIRKEFAPVRNP